MGAYGRESLAWGKWLESWSARREKTEAVSSEDDTLDSPVILEAPSPPPSPPARARSYKKSLRLSSSQIVSVCRCGGGGAARTVFPGPLGPDCKTAVFTEAQNPSPSVCHLLAPAYLLWGHLSVPLLYMPAPFFFS